MTNQTIPTPYCERDECKGKVVHAAVWHQFDSSVQEVASNRDVERTFDDFYDRFSEMMVDAGMPFPNNGETETDDDEAHEFRDWFTAQVIGQFLRP